MITAPLRECDFIAALPPAAVELFGPDQLAARAHMVELAQEVSWVCRLLLSPEVPLRTVAEGSQAMASEGWRGLVTDPDDVQIKILAKARAADNVATEQLRKPFRERIAGESLPPEVAEDGCATFVLSHKLQTAQA